MNAQPYTVIDLEKLGISVNKDIDPELYLAMFTVHEAGSTHGSGIFATRTIRPNEEIIRATGSVVGERIAHTLYFNYGIDVMLQVGSSKWILPNNEVRFVNHSCDPNMGFSGAGVFVAMRKISKGEELTFDYAMCEIDDSITNYIWSMKCLCGSSNCRRKISNLDIFDKKLGLANKYKGYLPAFVLKEINRRASK